MQHTFAEKLLSLHCNTQAVSAVRIQPFPFPYNLGYNEMPPLGILTTLFMLATLAFSAHAWGAGSERHQGNPGIFDYYSLTLLWAPNYCADQEGGPDACSGKRHLGFVLRSLSPMFETGLWPEYCSEQTMTSLDRANHATLYPAMTLMERDWAQHGTCSDLSASSFLQLGKDLLASVKIPAVFGAADQRLTREEVLNAFTEANPDLPENALTVNCTDRYFNSVHLCYDKTGTLPTACSAREMATAARSCPATFIVRGVK